MEVEEKWRGMESGAKREHSQGVTARKKTGVGKKPDSKIIKILETDLSFSGTLGGIDSGKPV